MEKNDLISRSALLEKAHWIIRAGGERVYAVHAEDVENAPAADVEPVRHGYWIANNICSVCKKGIKGWAIQQGYALCPHCGAKMDSSPLNSTSLERENEHE